MKRLKFYLGIYQNLNSRGGSPEVFIPNDDKKKQQKHQLFAANTQSLRGWKHLKKKLLMSTKAPIHEI